MNKIKLLLAVYSLLTLNTVTAESLRPTTTKIGAILALTGEGAHYGSLIQQGIEMALAEGSKTDFEIIYEDDQVDRVKTVGAVNKLISADKTEIILNMVVNTTTAIAPILNKFKKAGIVIWDSNQQIATMGDYIFGLGYSTEGAAESLADYAVKKLGSKKIAVIYIQDEWADLYSRSFISRAKELGASIVVDEPVLADTVDFKSQIAKINARQADTTVGVLYFKALISWIRQSRQNGFRGKLLTADTISQNEIDQAGTANTEDLCFSQIWLDNQQFSNHYQKFSGKSLGAMELGFISLGYDAIACLQQIKHKVESSNRVFDSKALIAELPGFTCQGAGGPFRISNNKLSDKREEILCVHNGKPSLVK